MITIVNTIVMQMMMMMMVIVMMMMVILVSFEAKETAAWLQIARMFFHSNLTNKAVSNSM